MKICRECGFMKSDNYEKCPDCNIKLDDFDGYEEYPEKEAQELMEKVKRS